LGRTTEQQTESKLPVVIDANVFYDLAEPPNADNELSHSLLADWLDIEPCLTNEIRTEINRNDDPAKRQRFWEFVYNFKMVTSPNDATQDSLEKLRDLFPIEMSPSDASDLRQIAKAIAANIQFFVTNDRDLLKKSEQVYERFGMHIIHPTNLIIHQDALIREAEYQPARLAGSYIQRKRVSLEQSNLLENLFQYPQSEKKSDFRQKIHSFLADPHTFEVDIIQSGEQPLAFIVYSRQNAEILEIPFLRVVDDPLASPLVIHLIHNAVALCVQEGRILTKFTEKYLSDAVLNALRENEFVLNNEFWVKANIPVVEKTEALRVKLDTLNQHFPVISDYFQQLSEALQPLAQQDNIQTLLQVEKSLWPAKIADLHIPAYIISIHPQWAMDLFDPNIANQTLFGADPFLILNVENVYYRSSRTKLSAPARILWYVNQGKGNFQGTMAIRACSYLDEVIIDKPKALFSRFKRLGVYTWEDVFKVAKEDIEQEIMAFRFSKTEVFSLPIHRNDLQTIWIETKGRNFNIQGPLNISNDLFLRIYKSGLQI
jgi:predicted nucleic acid-binding protein